MASAFDGLMKEVMDEIESALKDSQGIIVHQRRLAFLLSLGTVALLEEYLKKKSVLKQGEKIDHRWLKKKKENAKLLIAQRITASIESLPEIDPLLDSAYLIEKDSNDMAYGKGVSEKTIQEKIDCFLELKKKVKNV
ncbi:MAG: hypothetical protein ABIJ21_05830 [Nanoarchaeota archaeon]